MRIIGYVPREPDETVTLIDAWFDHTGRYWVVQRKNAAGDQVGDSDMVGTKMDAKHAVSVARVAHPSARVVWSS